MIRVVVTALLAVALLAAALPAVEDAAADRSERQLRADVRDLDAAATDLLRSEEAVPGTAGARRTVEVTLPASGIAAREVEGLRISPADRRYAFRVEGRSQRETLGAVPVHTTDGEPLVLRGSGTHDLVLALVRVEGERRVVIARLQRVRDGVLGGSAAVGSTAVEPAAIETASVGAAAIGSAAIQASAIKAAATGPTTIGPAGVAATERDRDAAVGAHRTEVEG